MTGDRDGAGPGEALADLVARTPLNAPYWDALAAGRLDFQRCRRCHRAWLPPREECPACWEADWAWETASGRGRLVSWVVYHRAPNPAFTDRVPYNVALVELDEGPRLVTNLLGTESVAPRIEAPVVLEVQVDGGLALARFRLGGHTR